MPSAPHRGQHSYKEGPGYPALTPFSIDYSFSRRLPAAAPGHPAGLATRCRSSRRPRADDQRAADTDNNAADFIFVDTNGTSAGAGQRLGAPGPENLSSPVSIDGFTLLGSLTDPTRPYNAPPNYVRAGGAFCTVPSPFPPCVPAQNSTFGTMDIRQKFTNNTGANITRLRFRVVDITTFPSATGVADLRPITSSDIADPIVGTVRGTTLETPPNQFNGSGFNGSLSVGAITLATPLAPGSRVDVRFVLGVQQAGAARFCVVAETLPAASSQVFCFFGPTEGVVRETSQTFSNAAAIAIPGTGTSGPATPYPPTITIVGFTKPVARITVTLKQFSHTFPDDVDVLLVGPTGAKFILMSDALGSADATARPTPSTTGPRPPSRIPPSRRSRRDRTSRPTTEPATRFHRRRPSGRTCRRRRPARVRSPLPSPG